MSVPALRFSEFEGEWERKPIKELAEIKTGSRDTQNKKEGGKYPFYVRSDTIERINSFAYDGEAILTSGDGVGVGKNIHYVNEKFDYHQRVYAIYKFKERLSGQFFFHFFRENFLRRVMRLSAKNSVDSVRMSMIADMELPHPTLPEQKKIAAFLGAVDARIAGARKRRDLLETYKRGLMQALFSRTLRFTRDDGTAFPDWEEKRLGDAVSFSKGKGISKADISADGQLPCIRYGELYTLYSEVITTIISRTDIPANELILSQAGDVIIPASGEDRLDMARACCVLDAGIALGGDLNILRHEMNGKYLAYYLSNAKRRAIARYAQGNSVVHLYGTQLKLMDVSIPHPDEQQKIADVLSAMDAKIDAVAGKVAQLEAFKKGLLQQMFV